MSIKSSKYPSDNAPMWLVTFADLMSLLMCFFVLLLSFSTIDESKFKKMSTSLGDAFHSQPKSNSTLSDSQQQKIVSEPTKQATHQVDAIKELLSNEISQGLVTVETVKLDIIIRINETVSFPSGSAQLKAGFEPVMDKITIAVNNTSGIVHIAGHTDDLPISTTGFKSNWALAASRSVTVAHYMLNNKDIDPARIIVEGYANTRPLTTNDTIQNRAKNRRVEIIISQESRKL